MCYDCHTKKVCVCPCFDIFIDDYGKCRMCNHYVIQGKDEINRIFSSKYKNGQLHSVGEWIKLEVK